MSEWGRLICQGDQMADPTAIFSYFWRIFFRMAERFLWFSAISTKNYENSEWKFAHLLIWRNLSVKWRKIFILLAEAPFSFMVTLGSILSRAKFDVYRDQLIKMDLEFDI